MNTEIAYNDFLAARETDNEEQAIRELIEALRHHARSIIYLVLRRCDSDLEAEIVETAWFKMKQFQGKSRFSTWFYRLAMNKCRDFIRARRNNRESPFDEKHLLTEEINTNNSAIAVPELEQSEIFRYLQDNISEEEYVLLEGVVAGYRYKEIGKALNISELNTRVRWFRLRPKLIKLLEKYNEKIAQ